MRLVLVSLSVMVLLSGCALYSGLKEDAGTPRPPRSQNQMTPGQAGSTSQETQRATSTSAKMISPAVR